mmetsp:Transcript_109179/g.163303  ORF Transcript_109179/g.163303 Transcript_109179/m.163303 type:complete len:365 (-) Transcript_109179:128-1222(-)
MPGPMVILETAARLLQSTQSPDGLNNSTVQGDANTGNSPGRDAYEFVAFLLWYLFLVVCCVLPTCCAYRRRRLMEARIAQQQASFDQLHQQNVFILSNLHLRPDLDGEEARTIRTKRITDALKATTFTVRDCDIEKKEPNEEENGKKKESTIKVDEELGAVLDHETMDHSLLSLPPDGENANRTVPGGCAICLCPYESGDVVTWSREVQCAHAFHTECIVPWLAKKQKDPKCPCCRQDYCMIQPVTPADFQQSPFGFLPMPGGGILPTPDLVASQLVTENGFATRPLQPIRSAPNYNFQEELRQVDEEISGGGEDDDENQEEEQHPQTASVDSRNELPNSSAEETAPTGNTAMGIPRPAGAEDL